MTTVSILEGYESGSNYNDIDLLGWGFPKLLRPSTYKKAIRKVARPVAKLIRPVTRPVNRVLKKIPVVRSVYQGVITASYAGTGQFKEAWGSAKRTGKSFVKDFAGAKKAITAMAVKLVTPLANKGVSKNIAKVTAIPTATAFASGQFGPWAIPFVPVSVNTAINQVWSSIKKKPVPNKAKKADLNTLAKTSLAKMPKVKAPARQIKTKPLTKTVVAPKSGGAVGLLALIPLAFLMGA